MNATDALAASIHNDVYLTVDGVEKFIRTGCFQAVNGVRVAAFQLEDRTWVRVPADDQVNVRIDS
jgi:hypothetical protein